MSEANQNSKKSSSKTILIIDDDPLMCDLYTTKFGKKGFNVVSFDNVDNDIVSRVAKVSADILILDIDFAGKSKGLIAAEKLRADDRTKELKLVFLTNFDHPEDRNQIDKYHALDVLVKVNLTPSQVVERISELLEG